MGGSRTEEQVVGALSVAGIIAIVGFGLYCWNLVDDVGRLRGEVTARVRYLIALQSLRDDLETLRLEPATTRDIRGALVEGRFAAEDRFAQLERLDLVDRALAEDVAVLDTHVDRLSRIETDRAIEAQEGLAAIARIVGRLRMANGVSSEALGAKWDSLYLLVLISLLLSALTLLLLHRLAHSLRRVRDAEARVHAELVEREKDFRRVIEASPYGVGLQRDDKLVYANPALANALEYDPSELVGHRLFEFLEHPPNRRTDGLQRGEHTFVRAHGGTARLDVTVGPKVHFDGDPAELLVARDVSDQRMVEAQLRLADRLAAVGTIAAGVAHEINNPLTYVIANANVIASHLHRLADHVPDEEANALRSLLDDLTDGAMRVRHVVRGLKTLSHPIDEELAPLHVVDVVQSSLAVASSDLSLRATVVREFDDDLPSVWGNEARLGQVFLNLLVNAAQAFDDWPGEDPQVVVRARRDGERWVVIEIVDNGRGIPAALLSRVLDPFFTTKPAGVGTGLGLTICKRIVESLSGSLELASTDGEGTTVTVRLPVSPEEPAATVKPSTLRPVTPSAPLHRAEVLIIDDEARVAAALARLLRPHRCLTVNSGQEALELIRSRPFDIIFCDLMMPGVTGMDVHEQIREDGDGLEEHIVFVTGGAFTERARAFVTRVPNPLVEKPFDAQTVLRLVDASLRRAQPAARS